MKNRTYQHFSIVAIILLSISFLTGCNQNKNVQKETIVVTHEFPNANWSFEEQVLTMDFNIIDTTKDYRIEYYLTYDTTKNELVEVPVNVTLTAPDGMETFVTSTLHFDRNINKNITHSGNGSIYTMKLVVFPSRKFNQTGKYTATFYRKSPKYDNYGLCSLSLNVVPLKRK